MIFIKSIIALTPLFAGYCEFRICGTFIGISIFALLSTVALVLNILDKQFAKKSAPRISEKTLHTVELLGGWPGALITQHVIRHKTNKMSYRIIFFLIISLHLTTFACWLYLTGFTQVFGV